MGLLSAGEGPEHLQSTHKCSHEPTNVHMGPGMRRRLQSWTLPSAIAYVRPPRDSKCKKVFKKFLKKVGVQVRKRNHDPTGTERDQGHEISLNAL